MNFSKILYILPVIGLLLSCSGDDEGPKSTMCAEVGAATGQLYVYCNYGEEQCTGDFQLIGTYASLNSCQNDIAAVKAEYNSSGKIAAGPNALSTGNNSADTGSCGIENYTGPEFDIQIDSQCKAAYYYECVGNEEGKDAACAIYKQWQSKDSSVPNCPYCN